MERVLGVPPSCGTGTDEFQQAVRHLVQPGYTFRAFPIAFNHLDAEVIFRTLMAQTVGAEIVRATGAAESVHHALRVSVVLYPEGVMAVWVILAVYFRPL